MSLFASPCCKAALSGDWVCAGCGARYPVQDGVPLLMDEATRQSQGQARFDAKYRTDDLDPWGYEHRAAELLKYDFLIDTCASLLPSRSATAADVGCAQGLLAQRLAELTDHCAAIDLSPTAVAKLKARVGGRLELAAASALQLPFADASMQLLVLSDGLISWQLEPAQRVAAVREAARALHLQGHALFMEYLNPRRHHELTDAVREGGLTIERVELLHDRLWYVTESAFGAFRGTAPVKAIAQSVGWARALKQVSRLFGAQGSKHLAVIARR